MDNEHISVPLPPDYYENTLFLLVQSPKVLYVYWELSPGLKDSLEEKGKIQLRLNIEGRGPFYTTELDMSLKSFYFSDVEPGLTYNCELGSITQENSFYPLLRSNSVNTPLDRPAGEQILKEAPPDILPSSSSWGLQKSGK